MPDTPMTAAEIVDTPAWTPERMVTRLGGDVELARHLASLFVDECPRMLDQVRESLRGTNADTVRRAAHAFKGSVANFVDNGPAATAFELECLGRDNRLEHAPAVGARLEREVDALLVHLRRFAEGA